MRIAQISPLFESVPPRKYGGTERVVHYLTEELVAQGHDVTLFASGDSETSATLAPGIEKSLRLHAGYDNYQIPHLLMFENVRRRAHEFDIVHFHTDFLHFPTARHFASSTVTTLHGRIDIAHYPELFSEYGDMPLVSISHSQRSPIPDAPWRATVHHGLPTGLYRFQEYPAGYAAFLGRISPDKGPDAAIEIARRAGVKLRMAAKVDPNDRAYFERKIRPLIESDPNVEFIGEIGEEEKSEFLGNAAVLLFPIDWPEPFGLVMIEAMACGTPVVAFPRGAAPEVVEEGVTGFIAASLESAVERVRAIHQIDRKTCHRRATERFSMARVARAYLTVYEDLIAEHRAAQRPPVPAWKTSFSSKIRSI